MARSLPRHMERIRLARLPSRDDGLVAPLE
jgi:hypothetical protein